jgi:hypothetical protein
MTCIGVAPNWLCGGSPEPSAGTTRAPAIATAIHHRQPLLSLHLQRICSQPVASPPTSGACICWESAGAQIAAALRALRRSSHVPHHTRALWRILRPRFVEPEGLLKQPSEIVGCNAGLPQYRS